MERISSSSLSLVFGDSEVDIMARKRNDSGYLCRSLVVTLVFYEARLSFVNFL
jgi:hypothetical protein